MPFDRGLPRRDANWPDEMQSIAASQASTGGALQRDSLDQ